MNKILKLKKTKGFKINEILEKLKNKIFDLDKNKILEEDIEIEYSDDELSN